MTLKLPAGHFLGQTLRVRELSGLRLTETVYAPGLKLPRHSHELAKYCFVLAGSYVESVGQHQYLRQTMTLAFHPADTTHEEAHDAPGQHFLIELDTHWLERARQYSALLDEPVDLQGSAPIRL